MAYNRYRGNKTRSNFYNSGRMNYQTPDLPRSTPTPSTGMYLEAEYKGDGGSKTAWTRVRNYDIHVNKVDLQIAGAANIYGAQNQTESFSWYSDEVGIYTGDINDQYYNDTFRLTSTATRQVAIKYWGVQFNEGYRNYRINGNNKALMPTPEETSTFKGVYTWINNVNTLVQQIQASQTNDLAINTLAYQGNVGREYDDQGNPTTEGYPISKWCEVMTPLQYALIAYQTELMVIINYVNAFSSLVAQLPKLQELYYKDADLFVEIQNQLARSRFRAPIKTIQSWLKKRFVDKPFYKSVISPLMITSKKTDGLNSPLVSLIPILQIPVIGLACKATGYDTTGYDEADFTPLIFAFAGNVTRDAHNTVTGMQGAVIDEYAYVTNPGNADPQFGVRQSPRYERIMDAWHVDTILNLILNNATRAEREAAIDLWLQTAEATLQTILAATRDFGGSQVVIALEAALSKLASAPGVGTMNWQQNVELNPIPPVMKYTDWDMVNQLAFFGITTPRHNTNGYEVNIPMYRLRGIPKQLQLEYFQSFYMPSDETYMSFATVSNYIQIRFRDNHVVRFMIDRNEDEVRYISVDGNGQPNQPDEDYVSAAFQDMFTAISYRDAGNHEITWTNPQLMTYLNISFTNRSSELMVWATQNFILPLA